jgi:predicted  nucleic acid-binding Zn-ribbon protein
MTNDQINQFTSPDVESSENLEITVESLKSKVNQLETRISEFEKGKKKQKQSL